MHKYFLSAKKRDVFYILCYGQFYQTHYLIIAIIRLAILLNIAIIRINYQFIIHNSCRYQTPFFIIIIVRLSTLLLPLSHSLLYYHHCLTCYFIIAINRLPTLLLLLHSLLYYHCKTRYPIIATITLTTLLSL